jgi:hypothetical protein
MDADMDLFELSEEVSGEIQGLHTRMAPLLHPGAPATAQLLIRYIKELGGSDRTSISMSGDSARKSSKRGP